MLTLTKNPERINAKIDPSAINLVMDMLAKNYNDPIPSAIREYVANGVDTHRKENRKKRVLLYLPEVGDEHIRIADFGEGLSLEEIKKIYANFGVSTKRDDNTQIGSFGIGSKAGLAIADEVNITSRKNGVETSFSLIRDDKGIATLLKEEKQTNFPSGTIITIPHPPFDERITKRIRRMLSGWSKEEVFVMNLQTDLNNYRIPDVSETYPEGYLIPHKELRNVAQYSEDCVSVGGVLFPVSYANLENKMNHTEREEYESFVHYTSHIILRLPIEEAEIAYSRERIIENNEMLHKLKEQLIKMVAMARKKTYDAVEKQPTLAKALRYLDENGFALSKLIEKEHLFYATNTPLKSEIIQKEKENRRVTWIKHTPKRIAVVQSTTEERSYGLIQNTWLCKNRESTIPTVLVNKNNLTAEEKRKLRTVGCLLWGGGGTKKNQTKRPIQIFFFSKLPQNAIKPSIFSMIKRRKTMPIRINSLHSKISSRSFQRNEKTARTTWKTQPSFEKPSVSACYVRQEKRSKPWMKPSLSFMNKISKTFCEQKKQKRFPTHYKNVSIRFIV